jgi:hypothetical protein
MRTLVWLLLALNVAAAALGIAGFRLPAASPPPEPAASPNARRLQLLSELPTLPPRLDGPAAAELTGGEVAITPPASAAAPAPGDAPASAPVVESVPLPREPASSALPTPSPTETASAPGDTGAAAAVPGDVAEGASARCFRTGVLGVDSYQAGGAALREAGFGEPVLRPEGGARPRYWVYWDGAAADLEAVEARLKSAGGRDWYRTRSPDGATRLSMGVYGQADGARRRQRELAAKGVQTAVAESYRPPARLRWTVTATAAAVASARERLLAKGVSLEACY